MAFPETAHASSAVRAVAATAARRNHARGDNARGGRLHRSSATREAVAGRGGGWEAGRASKGAAGAFERGRANGVFGNSVIGAGDEGGEACDTASRGDADRLSRDDLRYAAAHAIHGPCGKGARVHAVHAVVGDGSSSGFRSGGE